LSSACHRLDAQIGRRATNLRIKTVAAVAGVRYAVANGDDEAITSEPPEEQDVTT
jgi:hypothetical protein